MEVTNEPINRPWTSVVNLRNCNMGEFTLIDRRTAFGNPFVMGRDGNREEVIAKYKEYFYNRMNHDKQFEMEIYNLVGCRLGCWCHPLPCHGNVIADFLNKGYDNSNDSTDGST